LTRLSFDPWHGSGRGVLAEGAGREGTGWPRRAIDKGHVREGWPGDGAPGLLLVLADVSSEHPPT
ncbi:MAG: hypothetical protein AB7G35_16210, partial [Hyphomicrobiaceae bacterium]